MRRFAEGTSVEVVKSKADIERLVTQHGATGFMTGYEEDGQIVRSMVMFRLRNRMLKYKVERPHPERFKLTKKRIRRKQHEMEAKAEAEHRRRWRALFLIIKAKLEIVETADDASIAFDREFMADIMLPSGQTLGDEIVPRIAAAYETGNFDMPRLLPGE